MDSIKNKLEVCALYDIEELFFSKRSDRKYFSAYRKNDLNHIFIKIQIRCTEESRSKICKEKTIYNILGLKTYLLGSFQYDEYVASDFLDGYQSLRYYFENESEQTRAKVIQAFRCATDTLNQLNSSELKMSESVSWDRLFRQYYTKLGLSRGWWNVAGWRVNIREHFLGYSGYILSLPFKYGWIPLNYKQTVVHGDLHLANVMLSEISSQVIDLENIKFGAFL